MSGSKRTRLAMLPALLPALLLIAAAMLAMGVVACSDDESDDAATEQEAGGEEGAATGDEATGEADPETVAVIEDWSKTLRGGDERGAAELFATPSLVDNGTGPLPLDTRADALAFNRSLPCGAELLAAERRGELTIATFRLTERPGPGRCGQGTGSRARTAFEVADGEITVWQRVPTRGDGSTAPAPSDPV